jgi:HEAT repeat protein
VHRLQQALGIRRGEEAIVARVVAVMLVAWSGAVIGSSAAESLFFARFGPEYLPYMYIAVGLVTFPAMLGISAVLARTDRRRGLIGLLSSIALFVVVLRGLILLGARWVYPPLWLGMMIVWTVLGTLTWGLAGLVHDTRQAKRLFPLYGAGAILGGSVGGLLTAPLASLLHSENLLLVWVASLVGTLILATPLLGRGRPRRRRLPGPRPGRAGLLESVLQGSRYVRRSALARWMSLAVVILGVLYFSLSLYFAKAATERFPNPDSLSGFLGLFTGVTNAVALILSLGVANRLFARFGVPTAVLTFPVIYLIGFSILVVEPSFAALAGVRFLQLIWMYGIWTTGWQALRGVVPIEWREQVRAFMDGGPVQAGVVLSGLFLLLAQESLSARKFFIVAVALAAAAIAVSWRMRRAYTGALVEALRTGWPEVFEGQEEAIGGALPDRAARGTLIEGMNDPEPGVRRVAVELLGSLTWSDDHPAILERLKDEDAGVRLAAVRAVERSGSADALAATLRLIDDPHPEIRAAAADALAGRPKDGIEVGDELRRLLHDRDPHVRLHAASALVRISNDPSALEALEAVAGSSSADLRAAAMIALADGGFRPDLVAGGLRDEDPGVREAAARALPAFGSKEALEPLLATLEEEDVRVRNAIADALVKVDGNVAGRLAGALDQASTEETALQAIVRLPDADAAQLRSYAAREKKRALGYHQAWSLLASHSDLRIQPLVASLRHAALRHAQHAVHAPAPLNDLEALELALPDLTRRDPNQRAIAIETVETLSDPAFVRPLLSIWEPQVAGRPAGTDVWRALIQDEDDWIRACAAFAAPAFGDVDLQRSLRDLAETDQDATVREVASLALERGPSVRTTSTLQLMDRVVALGQVPLFRELSPADLRHVAESMSENAYVDGTVIAEQGDPGDVMHVVVSGEIRALSGDGSTELARRGPGYIVGEMAVLGEQPRMANLVAVGEVKSLSIDRKRFQRILRERPDAALAVMRELCARLTEAHGTSRP